MLAGYAEGYGEVYAEAVVELLCVVGILADTCAGLCCRPSLKGVLCTGVAALNGCAAPFEEVVRTVFGLVRAVAAAVVNDKSGIF